MSHKKRSELTLNELESVRLRDKNRPNRHKLVGQLNKEERQLRNKKAMEAYHKRNANKPKKVPLTKEEKLERARWYDKQRYLRDKEKRLAACRLWRTTKSGRDSKLKQCLNRIGCSIEVYYELVSNQCGMCAICGTTIPGRRQRRFSVDHNHITGRIRGLLCQQCNSYLGHIGDRLGAAQAMVRYLLEDQNAY
jgi:hypothetical protein